MEIVVYFERHPLVKLVHLILIDEKAVELRQTPGTENLTSWRSDIHVDRKLN